MKKEKTPPTAEQLYKRNQKKSKAFHRLAPVVYWLFIALAVVFFILTIQNSLGNLMEIFSLLDGDKLTGEQVAQNYSYLVEKWGEWVIAGEDGGYFKIQFIDVRAALFSGLMITFLLLTIACLIVAVILGKLLFPKLSQLYKDNNQDMVNLATLQTNSEIKKQKKDGWWS